MVLTGVELNKEVRDREGKVISVIELKVFFKSDENFKRYTTARSVVSTGTAFHTFELSTQFDSLEDVLTYGIRDEYDYALVEYQVHFTDERKVLQIKL